MAETVSEESGVGRSEEGVLSSQSSHSGEALAEWRSSEQVENGSALTSAPYWDTDDEDDGGPKPSELYGKYTWKIEKFSQITKRELRSSPFEVGGYKWYILIYPQGCDVCNHLSLFLCVANHDKLLPGWSHFAQFTIAVVNKDPKKSKYSDTLHRFWKKEHDWGWKKFMELSKIYEGFVELDTLIIKAQVQVIREKADRPFRCLDSQYRRELVRVYLTNVEQICRRFVEEKRGKLGKLIEDNARWSSFRAFWLGIDQTSRRRMSKEHTDVILKVVVKQFFVEKEVTSTLVMDSLYSGLKALEGQSKCRGRAKLLDFDEMPAPIIRVEKDTFVLVDDVLPLLERAAVEPLPPKDEKGPQNRTKDGNPGEDFNKDSVERDERRLTELGRRTVEIFVLAHIFSNKIEVAYQEAVALKRQEELIREEEAAWLAESEQKAKRGTNAKEKKTKKKQAKQKRNNRKGKDKERDERHNTAVPDKIEQEILAEDKEVFVEQPTPEKPDVLEDASDTSDVVESASEVVQVDSEERDSSPIKWDIDMSEGRPPAEGSSSSEVSSLSPARNGMAEKRSPSMMDDSSSTCSTDSLPSVVTIGSYKGSSISNNNAKQGSLSRGKSHKSKVDWANQRESLPPAASAVELMEPSDVPGISSRATDTESEVDAISVPSQVKRVENHQGLKEGSVASQQQKRTSNKEQSWGEVKAKDKTAAGQPSSSSSPPRSSSSSSNIQQKTEAKSNASTLNSNSIKKSSTSNPPQHSEKAIAAPLANNWSAAAAASSRPETQRGGGGAAAAMPKPTAEKPSPSSSSSSLAAPPMSRPSSAPLVPAIRPPTPAISSMVQSAPSLARSASAVGRLGPDSSSPASTHSSVPQSYRNAIIGNSVASSKAAYTRPASPSTSTAAAAAASVVKHQAPYSQPAATTLVSTSPAFLPSSSTMERLDFGTVKPGTGFAFSRDLLSSSSGGGGGLQWMDSGNDHVLQTEMRGMDYYKQQQQSNLSLRDHHLSGDHLQQAAGTSGRQNASLFSDEFPHLDIINDLLDDEQGIGKFVQSSSSSYQPQLSSNGGSHSHFLNRQYSFPGELSGSGGGDLETSSSAAAAAASCRYERTRSYRENGFQNRSYHSNSNSFGSSYESMREYIPQASGLSYGNSNNGQMESLIQNHQWHQHHHHAPASDLSTMLVGGGGMKNNNHHQQHHPHLEPDSYSPYYSSTNMATGLNGSYNVFRPPNGH